MSVSSIVPLSVAESLLVPFCARLEKEETISFFSVSTMG